jgi:hypothetical protein
MKSRLLEGPGVTAKDYIDTKGYWISPEDRTIRRMGDEGGEQVAIAKATEECSDAEWNRICDALKLLLKALRWAQPSS